MKNKEKYQDEILKSLLASEACKFKQKYILKKENCNNVFCSECRRITKDWFEQECDAFIVTYRNELFNPYFLFVKNNDVPWLIEKIIKNCEIKG